MSAVFADTSGLMALLNAKDAHHHRAARGFAALRTRQAPLVSTSFVLVETYALFGRRLGLDESAAFKPILLRFLPSSGSTRRFTTPVSTC